MRYLNIKQAAEYLGVSRNTIYKWIEHSTDLLPILKFGKKSTRIVQEKLDHYVERRFSRNRDESKFVEIKPA